MDNQVINNIPSVQDATAPTITTFNDLCGYAAGQVVELPPFAVGQPFVARLRRPSLMGLVNEGKIPNTLLRTAMKMFEEGTDGEEMMENEETLDSMMNVMDILCSACLIAPTFEEIKNSGVQLTDEQRMAIFNYSQTGVVALNNFRQE